MYYLALRDYLIGPHILDQYDILNSELFCLRDWTRIDLLPVL